MSDPADALKLKPRRAATAQSAAGAYGAMQARSVPAPQISPAAAPGAAIGAATEKSRGFLTANWPLMTAAAALLVGGVAIGMAVGHAPRPQPARVATVAALLATSKDAPENALVAPTTQPQLKPEQGWRPVSDLAKIAAQPAAEPSLPLPALPDAPPEPVAAVPAVTVEPPKPEQPAPVVAAAPPAPAAAPVATPAAPAPKAAIAEKSKDKPVLTAAPVAPPSMAPRAAGDVQAWRARAVAPPATAKPPFVAFLIDDAGLDRKGTQRAIKLPGPVTLSFMSYANEVAEQSAAARAAGHEIMLHLPMEPLDAKRNNPGPNALYVGLEEAELQRRLAWHLDRFPDYVGVNNHMGSRFTANAAGMALVMNEIGRRQVFWLDSLSGPNSAGPALARQRGLDAAERDLFLDDERSPGIAYELAAMERVAKARGDVIAIGHPHASTLGAIENWMASAKERGFSIVPVSTVLLRRQQQER